RENFSKLGWQANVIWRIAISTYMQFDASTVQVDDLIRGSLTSSFSQCRQRAGSPGLDRCFLSRSPI
ncbi:MAG: hypothetical protein ABR991_11855, partial [Terracidiphilus sp.]